MGSELLWLDIVRNKVNFRVVIFRSRLEDIKYVIKVAAYDRSKEKDKTSAFDHRYLKEPHCYMNIRSLPENSFGIRQ